MADTTTTAGAEPVPETVAPDTVDDRGTLEVRTKALQHIVERTVLDTPGTVAHQTRLGGLTGSNSPHATITMQGRVARVAVDVACTWPAPMARIARDVRAGVLAEASRLSGVEIRSVDVTIHPVHSSTDHTERRRVQ